MSATTAGVIVGTLKEQHADCIVLSGSERIPLCGVVRAVTRTVNPRPWPGPLIEIRRLRLHRALQRRAAAHARSVATLRAKRRLSG